MNMKKLLIFLFVIIAFESNAQVQVYPLTNETEISDKMGFIYNLPETKIVFRVTIRKLEKHKGPYADYANKYVNISNVIKNDHSTYEIVNVRMHTEAIPDPNRFFFVELSKKEKNSIGFHLNNKGFLMDMSGIEEGKTMEKAMEKYLKSSFQKGDLFKYRNGSNLVETTDTIVRKLIIDTIEISKKFFKKKWALKGSENNAREAAKMIEKLKTARYNLLTGYNEVAYNGAAIQYMDSQLQKMEEEYLAMFSGATVVKEITYTFSVIPKDPGVDMLPVFTFSERTGLHHAGSKLGETIYLEMEKADLQEYPPVIFEEKQKNLGLYYNIPLQMNLKLNINDEIVVQGSYPIAQFGKTARLPANIRSVGLDENTGNVRSVLFR
jgi:hypothetical protein